MKRNELIANLFSRASVKRSILIVLAVLGVLAAAFAVGVHWLFEYVLATWDRAHIEAVVSANLNRHVHFGPITWQVGLQGVSFATDSIEIRDDRLQPLLISGPSEISFALTPLCRGQLMPKEIRLVKPEFWAERLAKNDWNFSDLPQLPKLSDLTYIKVKEGKLHLIDKCVSQGSAYRSSEFENVDFILNHHFGKLLWPFALSVNIPQPEGKCNLSMNGIGYGAVDTWQQSRYTFEVKATNLDLMRLTKFMPAFPEIVGIVDVNLKGEGTPDKEFKGTAKVKANNLILTPPGLGPIKVSDASSSARVVFNKNIIEWKDLNLKMGGGELKSDGKLQDWLSSSCVYEAKLSGHLDQLGTLLKHIDSQWISTGLKSFPKNLAFDGSLASRGSISAAPGKQKYSADVTVKDGVVMLKGTPFVARTVSGGLNFDEVGLTINLLKGKIDDGSFEVSGKLIPEKNVALSLKGKQLPIDDLKVLMENLKLSSPFLKIAWHGNVDDASAKVNGVPNEPKISFAAKPVDVVVDGQNHKRLIVVKSGNVNYDGVRLKMDKVRGEIGKGQFEVDGSTSLEPHPVAELTVTAGNLNLSEAKSALQALDVNLPALADQPVDGKVKEVHLQISGKLDSPVITMALQPDELVYQPIGPSYALHLKGGAIHYGKEAVELKDMIIDSASTHLPVSLKLVAHQDNVQLKELAVKGGQVDFKELCAHMNSEKSPIGFKKVLDDFTAQTGIKNIQGRFSGDLTAVAVPDGYDVNANGTLQSVQFQRSGRTINFDNGTVTSDDNGNVCIKSLSGSTGKTTFVAGGCVHGLGRSSYQLTKLDVNSQVQPEDLLPLLSNSNSRVEVRCDRPLKLAAHLTADKGVTHGRIFTKLTADTHCAIKLGDAVFEKPKDQPLKIKSVFDVQGETIKLGTSQIDFGTVAFDMSGAINHWTEAKPDVDMKIVIHDPVPISDLRPLMDRALLALTGDATAGKARLGVHFFGPVDNTQLTGKCRLTAVDFPKIGLSCGSALFTYGFDANGKPATDDPIVRMNFSDLRFQSLPMSSLTAEATLHSNGSEQSLQFSNLEAALAKGKITASGSMGLGEHKPFALDLTVDGIDTSQLLVDLGGKKNEMTGAAGFQMKLNGNLDNPDGFLSSLCGSGQFQVANGRVAKLSELQIKIEQGQVLESGILGFNLANVLSTVNPSENGEFLSTSGRFDITNGVVKLEDLVFHGEEMQLRASGTFDMVHQTLKMEATGDIPRVANEGTVGKVTSLVSLSGVVDFVAKDIHLHTPSVPVLGSVSTKPTRSFAFAVDANLAHPETVDQTIRKSFKWTNADKPRATASGGKTESTTAH